MIVICSVRLSLDSFFKHDSADEQFYDKLRGLQSLFTNYNKHF